LEDNVSSKQNSRAEIIADITARVPAQELSYFLQRRFGVTLITSRFLPLGALKQIQAAIA
jgi:hypothetical protein